MKHIRSQSNKEPVKHERGADRFDTELPVEMGGIQGLTRNISATGVYFETETAKEPGSRVHFTVELNVLGQKLKLICEGEVVRVHRNGSALGVAARLVSSFFSDAAEVIEIQPGSLAGMH